MENNKAGKTVLAADDSAVARMLLSRQLTSAGYRVVTAGDGIEAAQQAYSQSPDLIILDISMPRLNGYQVCRLLKHDQAVNHIPVIILTGAESRGTEFWSLRTGADAFLFKGAEPAELLATVANLLEQATSGPGSPSASAHGAEGTSPPTSEEILSKVCALMDDELYATTIERIEMKTILQNLKDGVLTLDLEGKVTGANRALCRMVGKEENELMSQTCLGALGDPAGSQTRAAVEAALSVNRSAENASAANDRTDNNSVENTSAVNAEQRSEIRDGSGHTTPVIITAVPLRDFLGAVVGSICLFHDITPTGV